MKIQIIDYNKNILGDIETNDISLISKNRQLKQIDQIIPTDNVLNVKSGINFTNWLNHQLEIPELDMYMEKYLKLKAFA